MKDVACWLHECNVSQHTCHTTVTSVISLVNIHVESICDRSRPTLGAHKREEHIEKLLEKKIIFLKEKDRARKITFVIRISS